MRLFSIGPIITSDMIEHFAKSLKSVKAYHVAHLIWMIWSQAAEKGQGFA